MKLEPIGYIPINTAGPGRREIAGTRLRVGPIEAIDGTPVVHIKAVW